MRMNFFMLDVESYGCLSEEYFEINLGVAHMPPQWNRTFYGSPHPSSIF